MSDNPNNPNDQEAYKVTLKAGKDFSDPWLVIRAHSIDHLHDRVRAASESGIMATIGNTAKSFQAAYQMGAVLDAQPISPPKEPERTEEAPKAPAKRRAAPKKAAEKPSEAPESAAQHEGVQESPEAVIKPTKEPAEPKKRPTAKWKR